MEPFELQKHNENITVKYIFVHLLKSLLRREMRKQRELVRQV